jgi:CheY-like chemotaxis protein/DNA-binding XRE family transcriptional regulator
MATINLKILLGVAIKTQRNSLDISQEELAYRAGLHRTYISDLERGVRNPSVDSIGKLARALEVSVSDLFEKASDGNGSNQIVEILFVGDNADDVELTKRAFAKANITNPVHVVRGGAEALDFLFADGPYTHRRNAGSPQLILLDLNLPRKSGLEVLREIKADERTRKIPVILLTGSNRDRDITECRRLGAVFYILKPVEFQNFSEVTSRLNLGWMLIKPNTDMPAAT